LNFFKVTTKLYFKSEEQNKELERKAAFWDITVCLGTPGMRCMDVYESSSMHVPASMPSFNIPFFLSYSPFCWIAILKLF